MDNQIKLNREEYNGFYFNTFETQRVIMGFTERGFPEQELPLLYRNTCRRAVFLNQVHGNSVYFTGAVGEGVVLDGDGWVVDERGVLAVIQTADCTPLFFWDEEGRTAGVLHVGWQGLWQGIEERMLDLVVARYSDLYPRDMHYYMGPAIEQKCYEVGQDLVDRFAEKKYAREIFAPHPTKGEKYLMDVRLGIRRSLESRGVPHDRIKDSGLCTYCETERFPSYRRVRESGERIYSFIMIR